MNDNSDEDRFLNVGRFHAAIGTFLIVVGITLMLWGKPNNEPAARFISQQLGVALLTAGAIDLLIFTAVRKLKEHLSRDVRERHQRLNEIESKLMKQTDDIVRHLDGILERADQVLLSTQLEIVRGDISGIKVESSDNNRRLEQIQEELELVRLAVDQEFRQSLTGPQGDLLRRARKELRKRVGQPPTP